jgi:hypothetical protein
MTELDFESFYLLEVSNTSDASDDVDSSTTFAGNTDQSAFKSNVITRVDKTHPCRTRAIQ